MHFNSVYFLYYTKYTVYDNDKTQHCLINSVQQLKEKNIVKTLHERKRSGSELFWLNFQPFVACFLMCFKEKKSALIGVK